jgi:hypothetical protein
LKALGKPSETDGIGLIDVLNDVTKVPIPTPLMRLKACRARFNKVVSINGMETAVRKFCGL